MTSKKILTLILKVTVVDAAGIYLFQKGDLQVDLIGAALLELCKESCP